MPRSIKNNINNLAMQSSMCFAACRFCEVSHEEIYNQFAVCRHPQIDCISLRMTKSCKKFSKGLDFLRNICENKKCDYDKIFTS